jgi:hypothetical protein
MSAIADFTVAVLDCPTCCRRFIENRVVMTLHRERVACPHCGARYASPLHAHDHAAAYSAKPVRCANRAVRRRRTD